jgi:hypothetical protein
MTSEISILRNDSDMGCSARADDVIKSCRKNKAITAPLTVEQEYKLLLFPARRPLKLYIPLFIRLHYRRLLYAPPAIPIRTIWLFAPGQSLSQ